jgi:hypothetical protein
MEGEELFDDGSGPVSAVGVGVGWDWSSRPRLSDDSGAIVVDRAH